MNSASAFDHGFPAVNDETVRRYRKNYSIPESLDLTKEMVQHHMELEYELTQRLWSSSVESRRQTWIDCYSRLYRELPWLTVLPSWHGHNSSLAYGHFLKLIKKDAKVLDVGSGEGQLASFLSEHGRRCVATEITDERGLRDDQAHSNITWHETDGVHLDAFETDRDFDVVVSTQVIEHLHPNDLDAHFDGAFAILNSGGLYVFNTPHALMGPADLSVVFDLDRSCFMHLKEYTHYELGRAALKAGFGDLRAIYVPPSAIRKHLSFMIHSRLLYRYLCSLERLLVGMRSRWSVRLPRMLLRAALFSGDVFMSVKRPAESIPREG